MVYRFNLERNVTPLHAEYAYRCLADEAHFVEVLTPFRLAG